MSLPILHTSVMESFRIGRSNILPNFNNSFFEDNRKKHGKVDIHGPWLSSQNQALPKSQVKADYPSTPPSSGPGDSTLSELAFHLVKAQNYRKTAASVSLRLTKAS